MEASPFEDDLDRHIARLVFAGLTNKAVAARTGLPVGTVKWRLHRMYRRMGVESRSLFVLALRDAAIFGWQPQEHPAGEQTKPPQERDERR
jgi:DNA-binding CsgD family transcriptional regulator